MLSKLIRNPTLIKQRRVVFADVVGNIKILSLHKRHSQLREQNPKLTKNFGLISVRIIKRRLALTDLPYAKPLADVSIFRLIISVNLREASRS